MNILTVENKSYNLDCVPEQIEDVRYCILNCQNNTDLDYYFIPLIFLESFNAPAIAMKIGDYAIQMPMDWNILIMDESYSMVEFHPIMSLNDRGFKTLVFNPLTYTVPGLKEIEVVNVFTDVKWHFPKLKNGHVLVIPLQDGDNPQCAMFVKDTGKIPNDIDISELFI